MKCVIMLMIIKKVNWSVDSKRKKENVDNLDTHGKELLKKMKKVKGKLRDNLDDKREQVKESDKIRKKEILDNLGDNKKAKLKNADNKRKKEKCDNLDTQPWYLFSFNIIKFITLFFISCFVTFFH